jgi:hypothetical protein
VLRHLGLRRTNTKNSNQRCLRTRSGKAVAVIYAINHDFPFLFLSTLHSSRSFNGLDHVQPAFTRLFIFPVFPISNPTSLVYTIIHSTILTFMLLIYSQTIAFLHCTII